MARTRKRGIWVATEGTYATDPSANGSGYFWVPALSQGELKDGRTILDTEYYTGRNFPTAPIQGADGWSFDMEVPVIGLSTRAGDLIAPPADDWFDRLLTHIYGSQVALSGRAFTSATTTTFTCATDVFNTQDLVAVFDPAVPTRTMWELISVDAGTGLYTVQPTPFLNTPTATGVANGTKGYQFNDTGGSTLAFVYREDDLDYTLVGGRCTAASIIEEAGKTVKMKLSFRGDNRLQEQKASLPAVGAGPSPAVTRGLLSAVYFNNVQYSVSKVEVNLGIKTAEIMATNAVNARAGDEMIEAVPEITIHPLRTDAILQLKRNVTTGRLLVQFGAGILSGSVLNTVAIHAEQATPMDVQIADDQGRLRDAIKFKVTDLVTFPGGATIARYFQMSRA